MTTLTFSPSYSPQQRAVLSRAALRHAQALRHAVLRSAARAGLHGLRGLLRKLRRPAHAAARLQEA